MNPAATFYRNVTLAGGPASVTTYDKKVLLKAVLDGQINPGKVFTHSYSLDEINQAYKDMADRKTIKKTVSHRLIIKNAGNCMITSIFITLYFNLSIYPKLEQSHQLNHLHFQFQLKFLTILALLQLPSILRRLIVHVLLKLDG